MSDVLIKINDKGMIPIINIENPKYAAVSPRIYKALLKAGVNVTMITEEEFSETTVLPSFRLEKEEIYQGQPSTSRPTSRRRPAIVLMDVVKKGEHIIEVIERQPDLEVIEEIVEKSDDDIAKELISDIRYKKDVNKLNKNQCKIILDYLNERCVYRDNLQVRQSNVKKALFSKDIE